MAVSSRGRNIDELHLSRKWKDRDTTPDRTRMWTTSTSSSTEANSNNTSNKLKNNSNKNNNCVAAAERKKVPVVYYLCRNGQLEHPHFMEVPLSSNDGLYLRDVINRLNLLRGQGMASLYSWSSKRSYKNGFVWHDLTESDLIHPAANHGHHHVEYVLKGSELLNPQLLERTPSFRSPKQPETQKQSPPSTDDSDFSEIESARRRNQSWSSIDLNEYKVYKTESLPESSTRKLAADASTQTYDNNNRRRSRRRENVKEEELHKDKSREPGGNKEEIIEISPPQSDSSPETLESLMQADGRLILNVDESTGFNRSMDNYGRVKAAASTVLMQLISCGSISFRDCGATAAVKEQGLSLTGQCCNKEKLPRGGGNRLGSTSSRDFSSFRGVKLEDKEYFSGSLIETTNKNEEIHALKRSNSCNEDRRSSQLQLAETEIEGVRTKCIPRKSKAMLIKKESNVNVSVKTDSTSQPGGKKPDVQQVENEAKWVYDA